MTQISESAPSKSLQKLVHSSLDPLRSLADATASISTVCSRNSHLCSTQTQQANISKLHTFGIWAAVPLILTLQDPRRKLHQPFPEHIRSSPLPDLRQLVASLHNELVHLLLFCGRTLLTNLSPLFLFLSGVVLRNLLCRAVWVVGPKCSVFFQNHWKPTTWICLGVFSIQGWNLI